MLIFQSLSSNNDGWRPVKDSPKYFNRAVAQAHAAYRGTVEPNVGQRLFTSDSSTSNKIEVFAPAPPSILGSFTDFGHATVKAREPANIKKKGPTERYQIPSRPKYSSGLIPPPLRGTEIPSFKSQNSPYQQNEGQAYYFEASLTPPPRTFSNRPSSPNSNYLPPNSYYMDFSNQNSGNTYSGSRKPASSNNYDYYMPPHSNSHIYGPPRQTNFDSSFRGGFRHDHYYYYSPELSSSNQYHTNRGKPTNEPSSYRSPFGDIALSTRRPYNQHPSTVDKNPGIDVYEQLSHLGRPFQNHMSTPLVNEYSSQRPVNYLTTSVNGLIHSTPDTSSSNEKNKFEPLYRNPIYDSYTNIQPDLTVTRQPLSQEVFPIPVTTVDVPSPDEIEHTKAQDTFSSGSYKSANTEFTSKPGNYYFESTTESNFKPLNPQPEIKTYSPFNDQPTHFIPTPATSVEPFINEPTPNEAVTTIPEDFNEIRKPLHRNRFSQLKHTDLPIEEDLSTIETSTQKQKINRHKNKKNHLENKYNNYDPLPNNEPPPRKTYITKHRRRRPQKPQDSFRTEQTTEIVQKLEEVSSILENKPTVFTEYPTGTDNELPTVLPSQVVPQRRRKKPHHRNRVSLNRHRPSEEQNLVLTTITPITTTTIQTETESISNTDYSTELTDYSDNYKLTNISPSKLPDIKDRIKDNYPENTNTFFPTQQIDDLTTTEVVTSPIIKTSSTTTTSTTTTEPSTTASTSRTRLRGKYGNHTRPRFSVKEYRERLSRTTTTQSPPNDTDNNHESLKTNKRNRGSTQHKNHNEDNQQEESEVTTKKYKSRYSGVRYSYRSTTTTPSSLQVDTPTTTERLNSFRPAQRHRPGTGKYYSRYRTSTETPSETQDIGTTAASVPIRPKGVFSAKRRPYPLRTRYDTSTKSNDDIDNEETLKKNEDSFSKLPSRTEEDVNEVASDHVLTDKVDNADTTTTMTSSEENNWNYPSSLEPETFITDPSASSVFSQKVADLTSSPSNAYDSSGFFKGVSPSSRRTVSQITLATDDPILPIEAFFQSWSSQKETKETR